MAQQATKPPYVYQPYGMQDKEHWVVKRVYAVVLESELAVLRGLTKDEAYAIRDAVRLIPRPLSPHDTTKYRKKPVVIEAWQVVGANQQKPYWLSEAMELGTVFWQGGDAPYFTIETLEGNMRADIGDWIIRGVKGELYPCKPDIFEATYEPAQ